MTSVTAAVHVVTAVDLYRHPEEITPVIRDLYTEPGPYRTSLLLVPPLPAAVAAPMAVGYNATELRVSGETWTNALAATIPRQTGNGPLADIVHCHQLGTEVIPALTATFPELPRLRFLHPAELARAEAEPTFREAMAREAIAVDAIAVPSDTSAALTELAPSIKQDRIVMIPWPVPDHLLDGRRFRRPARPRLRVLYAGPADKGLDHLLEVCARAGAHLVLACTGREIDAVAPLPRTARVLEIRRDPGREKLWELIGDIDVAAVPDASALGLSHTALDAQALGVPVICRAGSGTAQGLPWAMRVDFAQHTAAAAALTAICADPTTLVTHSRTARECMEGRRLTGIHALIGATSSDLIAEVDQRRCRAGANSPLPAPPAREGRP